MATMYLDSAWGDQLSHRDGAQGLISKDDFTILDRISLWIVRAKPAAGLDRHGAGP